MAHEALVSLNQLIIERFRNRLCNSYFPILETTDLVLREVWSLKSILELDHFKESERLNALKGEILEAIPKFRDLLQDHINKCLIFPELHTLYSCGSSNEWEKVKKDVEKVKNDLKKVKKEMISFVETMKKINKEYNAKLDQETSNKVSPFADEDFGGNTKDMVGVYDEDLQQLIHKLLTGESSRLNIIRVVGMAGIGKTTIVKALYNDPVIKDYFDTRAFVRLGPDYDLKDILLGVLVCLSPDYNKILGIEKSFHELKKQMHKFLKGRRYLIVLDDVWDTDFWDDMRWCIPNENKGSKIIFTTRLFSLASNFSRFGDVLKISFRNEEESWNLFCRKVFVEDSCPPGLEKVGKLSKNVEDFLLE